MSGALDTANYRNAPSGDGPLAETWEDKPHRLLYDLCSEVERLQKALAGIPDSSLEAGVVGKALEAIKLAMACEPEDWRIWHDDMQAVLALLTREPKP